MATPTTNAPIRPGPRERLLLAVEELTSEQGVTVGVDAILKRADVARRSLYHHFGGKDRLLAEAIRRTAADDERRYRAALDAGGTEPRARLTSLFETIERITATPGFHGCRYTAATLTLTDPAHPAHAEVQAHKKRIEELLRSELEQLELHDPGRAGAELFLLIEGALAAAANRPGSKAGSTARTLAARIIDG